MARPQKSGLDYFSLDVVMSDEVEIIEAQFGLPGFALLIKLYQKIYSEGYYLQWGDREQILFSNRVNVDKNLLTSIIDECIKWNLFDAKLYQKYQILTSRRIQTQYFSATYKRTGLEAIKEYLLIDISDRSNVVLIGVSDINNLLTTNISPNKSTQSKVKESKVKKSIEENKEDISLQIKNLRSRYSPEELSVIDEYFDILRFTRRSGKIADSVILKIYTEWEKYSIPKVIYALKVYINNPKHHDKQEHYCYGIMRNAKAEEIETKTTQNKIIEDDNPFRNRSIVNGT